MSPNSCLLALPTVDSSRGSDKSGKMQQLVVVTLCFLILVYFYQSAALYLKRRKFQKDHGCLPPPKLPQIERLIGFDKMLENLDCWKRKTFLACQRSRFNTVGATYRANIAGSPTLFTVEPGNIKAIFSDRFDDFDVGWLRLRAFAPANRRSAHHL